MNLPENLTNQLKQMPPKVAKPLFDLHCMGHLDSNMLNDILLAGRQSGNTTHLLGFPVSYLALRAQHVPVGDVIRMAARQGRGINLTWSAKRWSSEHDRLARAETLQKLASLPVRYELEDHRQYLPRHFKGYLVPSSKRLGQEGLRQRHCVAGYHDQIVNGSCAIASVFVNHERWTVQLVRTHNMEFPLRVVQIKSKHNTPATSEVRSAVLKELGICEPPSVLPTSGAEGQSLYLENLRRVLPILRDSGVVIIVVSFNGYGDNGAIEEVAFEPSQEVETHGVFIRKEHRAINAGAWTQSTVEQEVSLSEAVSEITYDYLQHTGIAWYNNEGGLGTMIIDVQEGTVEMQIDVRRIEPETAYFDLIDIATGDDIH